MGKRNVGEVQVGSPWVGRGYNNYSPSVTVLRNDGDMVEVKNDRGAVRVMRRRSLVGNYCRKPGPQAAPTEEAEMPVALESCVKAVPDTSKEQMVMPKANESDPVSVRSIPASLLLHDGEYQREPDAYRVEKMAKNYNHALAGALLVGRRRDGRLFVVDGWNRCCAGKMSGKTEFPCTVFVSNGQSHEADLFYRASVGRRQINTVERHHALLAKGHADALIVEELAREAGRSIERSSSATTLSCVGEMYVCVRSSLDTLRRVWPLVVRICEGKVLNVRILKGVFYVETHSADSRTVTEKPVANRLLAAGSEAIIRSVRASAEETGVGLNAYACGMGVLKIINHKVRGQRFAIDSQRVGPSPKPAA